MNEQQFSDAFERLTDNKPLSWQWRLYRDHFAPNAPPDLPQVIDLPTGLGKTMVIAIWLIALASGSKVPRRLVYVVNRRKVVDQTTVEAEKLRRNLVGAGIDNLLRQQCAIPLPDHEPPLAISTIRGQFADNRQWSTDPCRPAIICGTVDMIGSRLLFSGYGVGFKSKPLQAGFLGQDALLIHDEAHLQPAFQKLVESIRAEQERCREFKKLHVIELTATTRNADTPERKTFALEQEDRSDPTIQKRIEGTKQLALTSAADDKSAPGTMAKIAAKYKDANVAVVVFVRTLDAATTIEKELQKTQRSVVLLTGTIRGKERDDLVNTPEFARFLKGAQPGETVYLISTSAGEVGIDISADHMVCDLATFESMAQRFGRVNRYGDRQDTRIDVVHPVKFDDKDKLAPSRQATLALLVRLGGDASPGALGGLMSSLSEAQRTAAFAPPPTILPATDILFDAWALTSIKGKLPGRPIVEPYLHGIREYEPPETQVAWRNDVDLITEELLDAYPPQELLEDYPLKPHELLRDRSDRVFKHLEMLAKRHPNKPVWVLDDREAVEVTSLEKLTDKQQKDFIEGCTVLLPPSVGGLTRGMLDGTSEQADDVADITSGSDQRIRIRPNDANFAAKMATAAAMRRVRSIELSADDGEDEEHDLWEWYESIPLGGGRTAQKPVLWKTHVDDVVCNARKLVARLSLPQELGDAIILAAEMHDHGKRRERFQLTLGNRDYPNVYWAKSGRRGARLPEPFRHEFASLFDAQEAAEFRKLTDAESEMQDVVLHLIAAHHGRARPHFTLDEAFEPDHSSFDIDAQASEAPRRFAHLERKYGRWGLAYLESVLRAADWAASAAPSKYVEEPESKR